MIVRISENCSKKDKKNRSQEAQGFSLSICFQNKPSASREMMLEGIKSESLHKTVEKVPYCNIEARERAILQQAASKLFDTI